MNNITDKLLIICDSEGQIDPETLDDKYKESEVVPGVCMEAQCDAVSSVNRGTSENICPHCGNYTVVSYDLLWES